MATTTHAIDTQTMASLPGMFFAQAARLEDRPFLWAKIDGVYRPRTWTTVHKQVVAAAHGLKAAGIKPGDRVMLVAENRPEWFIANMAIMTVGAIAVPAYTTNTALNHLHILNDSGSTAVIVSTPQLAKRVIAAASEANQKITAYVMDEPEKTIPLGRPHSALVWSRGCRRRTSRTTRRSECTPAGQCLRADLYVGHRRFAARRDVDAR